MHVVIIETEGYKPSGTYYKRRHKFGLRVRKGTAKNTTVKERINDIPGLIVQEGCVVTPSYSQAMAVVAIALEEGITDIYVGELDELLPAKNYRDDIVRVAAHLNATLGTRGRKPKPKDWTITCLECLETTVLHLPWPVMCPRCGGMNYKKRTGSQQVIARPEVAVLQEYWETSRFFTGWFEVPIIDPAGQQVKKAEITEEIEKELVEKTMSDSPLMSFLQDIRDKGHITTEAAANLLDAAFVSRTFRDNHTLVSARRRMISNALLTAQVTLPLAVRTKASITDVAQFTDKSTQASLASLWNAWKTREV